MNKKELIKRFQTVAQTKGVALGVAESEAAIDAFEDTLTGALKEPGDKVRTGLGTFEVVRVPERTRKIPQRSGGTALKTIPAHDKLVFRPSKDWKEFANAEA